MEELILLSRICIDERAAHTRPHLVRFSADCNGLISNFADQAVGIPLSFGGIAVGHQDSEFIASEPRHDMVWGTEAAQGLCNGDEHFIAGDMTAPIIHGLEAVQIHEA